MFTIANSPRLQPVRRLVNSLRLLQRTDVLGFEIHAQWIGFFAQLTWCLYFLAYCEKRKRNPFLRLTGTMYGDNPQYDWFHDYFEETNAVTARYAYSDVSKLKIIRVFDIADTQLPFTYHPSMTIEWAHRLFTTYYRVKQTVAAYVDDFVARQFAGGVIGVHFRGTDKKAEASPVDWPGCFSSVMKLAADHPELRKAFLSSDDPGFIQWFAANAKGTLSVIFHNDLERSRGDKPIHMNPLGDPRRKGFEAVVNCLLLSRCSFLIRSASFLSAWSSIFNPALPITLLNEPFADKCWFPDRDLLRRSDNRYR
jgi:hypothetical protein